MFEKVDLASNFKGTTNIAVQEKTILNCIPSQIKEAHLV